MVDIISNIGIDAQGGVGQTQADEGLQEEGLVQESVEMEYSYDSSSNPTDSQFLKLELNGKKYNGIPDIFQSEDPAIQTMFDTLRAESVVTADMSLGDQQKIMSYVGDLANITQEAANANAATAFNGTENVAVTSFISPEDPSVTALAAQLLADGVITSDMTDAEKLAAITSYVNANIQYETDSPGEGWSTAANTIASGTGDCEDMAILVANLALACGVDESSVQICVQGGSESSQGHVVVGIANENGALSIFDPVSGEQSTASVSDFTFTFTSQAVTSGDGSVGNTYAMEDANNVNSMYTASSARVRYIIGRAIDTTYESMLGLAGKLDGYTDPGALFVLQQELQTMKDMIATYTAVGKLIGDVISEAMVSFARGLSS